MTLTTKPIQTVQMTVEVVVHDDPILDDYDLKRLPEVVSDSLCGVLIDHLGAGISVRVSPRRAGLTATTDYEHRPRRTP